jgi:preprotein translocase subunit YajC
MILRDPPGSGSYSYFEQGSEYSLSKSTEVEHSETTEMSVKVDLGSKVVTFAGLGAGVITEVENIFDVTVGLERTNTYVDNKTTTSTISTTQTWSTSDDPFYNGTNGDVFIGFSTNIVYGVSTQINLLPSNMGEGHIGQEFGHNGLNYDIGVTKGLRMDPEFNTGFIFTQEHIKNYLIPNLQMIRNNFLINNPVVYQCVICDHQSEEFGRNNETGFKSENGYLGGDSYNVFIPGDWPAGELFEDSVAFFNKQIEGWEQWLAFNEKEKLMGTVQKTSPSMPEQCMRVQPQQKAQPSMNQRFHLT